MEQVLAEIDAIDGGMARVVASMISSSSPSRSLNVGERVGQVIPLMVGVPVRREQVAYARRRGLSQRRSCTLLSVARSALGYRSVKAERDAPVLARLTALASIRALATGASGSSWIARATP